MRYVFRKKLNYPYDNPLIQSEAKGTLCVTYDAEGYPPNPMTQTHYD